MLLMLIWCIQPAAAQIAPIVPFSDAAAETITTTTDKRQRLTVPVRLEDSGPWRFLIDTAAQRTLLSSELATELSLEAESKAKIVALAGSTTVATVYIPELTLGSRTTGGIIAPTFAAAAMGADGILGLDSLQQQRILFDFLKQEIRVEDSRSAVADRSDREIVVTARRRSGQLIFTEATIAGNAVSVIIDTGGELSIGNLALQRKLRLRPGVAQKIDLVDITGRSVPADIAAVADLRIDRARFSQLPIAFADIAPFRVLKLLKRPALFLGMDALRQFDRIVIDFANRKIRFLLPEDAPVVDLAGNAPDMVYSIP
ncbi:MAG: aspartyl protease family protein [Parasphingorhabdus sp.]|nr:aspartyl protease family protein [Parasphingorhabdus sp.]